jgi:hypothetical protein
MILDRLKKIETDIEIEILEETSNNFDKEIFKLNSKEYININIINMVDIYIKKNLKKKSIKDNTNIYINNGKISIKEYNSRLKTR